MKVFPCASNAVLCAALLSTSCRLADSASNPAGVVAVEDRIRWTSPSIPLCFDQPRASGDVERSLSDLLVNEYNKRTLIKFTGFDGCKSDSDHGIHVAWDNKQWPNSGLGMNSQSMKGGVTLPYDFSQSPVDGLRLDCVKTKELAQKCFATVALHEFGHALGLMHENLRPERAATRDCTFFDEGSSDEALAVIGEYDSASIMNKCFYRRLIGTDATPVHLSSGDVATINALYGSESKLNAMLQQCPAGSGYTFFPKLNKCLVTWVGKEGCPDGSIPDDRAGYCKDAETMKCVPTEKYPCPK